MKTVNQKSHRATVIALLVATLFCAAGFGLGVVWLRQQISHSARESAQMETELRDYQRRNSNLAARISEAHRPEELLARVAPGMRPTHESQVVRLRLGEPVGVPGMEQQLRSFESSVDLALNHQPRHLLLNE